MKLVGKQGSGPKEVHDLCFHTYGKFSRGWDLGLQAEIWAWRLGGGGCGGEGGGGGEGENSPYV